MTISGYLPAAVYYVDPVTGIDTRTNAQAQSQATPWKSIPGSRNVANTGALPTRTLVPGDVVEVKRGSTFGVATSIGRLEFAQSGTVASSLVIRCSATWGTGSCTYSGMGVTMDGYFGLVTSGGAVC